MMDMVVQIDLGDIPELIDGLTARVADDTPLIQATAALLEESVSQNIIQGGRPVPFKPRSKVTEKIIEYNKGSLVGSILIYEANLLKSIGQPSGLTPNAGPHGILKISKHHGVVGTMVPYAAKQQCGDPGGETYMQEYHRYNTGRAWRQSLTTKKISKRKQTVTGTYYRKVTTRPIPQRKFMMVQEEDMLHIQAIAKAWFLHGDMTKEIS